MDRKVKEVQKDHKDLRAQQELLDHKAQKDHRDQKDHKARQEQQARLSLIHI